MLYFTQSFDTIDQHIVQWFNSFGMWGNLLLIIISLFLACVLSGFIGFEREYHGHAAGLRTHMLVAVGSALVMIISLYGFGTGYSNRDPARLAAQVVSGIGFLGAGTIIQTGIDIKGLTTATTLWLVMGLGLACGAGQFTLALVATLLAFVTLLLLRNVEQWAMKRNPKILLIVPSQTAILHEALTSASRYLVKIKDIKTEAIYYQGNSAMRITITATPTSRTSIAAYGEELRTKLNPYEIKF